MLTNFRAYQLALQLYRECKQTRLPEHLRDQLLRAASSVVLNLAEGSAKPTHRDRVRFYSIALASCREVQAVIQLEDLQGLTSQADSLGAHIYKLTRA